MQPDQRSLVSAQLPSASSPMDAPPSEPLSPHIFAELVGTLIALLTLALPILMIWHFSSPPEGGWPTSYSAGRIGNP
jgi:hypothetical protein